LGDPGSHDKKGWRSILQSKLRSAIVRANFDYRGTEGGTSNDGAASYRVDHDMRVLHPAFTLIDWGVNDWNIHPGCDDPTSDDCPTIPNLQHIIQVVKDAHSLPCLATLTPPNKQAFPEEAARYDWVMTVNGRIRTLAQSEGALLVDIGDAFVKAGNPPSLFYDHIHPNDDGYALMADTFYAAITGGNTTSSSASLLGAFSLFETGLR
jgi:lysophospholipase L1-like esterase